MLAEPFQKAKPVVEKIKAHGYNVYFVGGCVRDFLLHRPIGDIDIATSAKPIELQNLFSSVIPVGIEHGTVIIRHQNESYEVTTFRVDGTYTDQRHPDDVTYVDSIDKDLERRDFTINALAMDLKGNIIDLFAGRSDLDNHVIRTVGNGEERFREDPLRIIRALRFSSQLGFTIHPDTIEHIRKVRHEMKGLAVERITREFTKLFAGDYVQHGLTYVNDLEIYKYLPVFEQHHSLIYRIPKNIKPLPFFHEVLVLFHFLDRTIPLLTWVKAWKCSNKQKNAAMNLTKQLEELQANDLTPWLVYQLPRALYNSFIRLTNCLYSKKNITMEQLLQIEQTLPITSRSDIKLSGQDIIDLFPAFKQGPWIQQLLNKLERKVVAGQLPNDYYKLKEWIKWNPPAIN
ncbi:CCA tRNA nucleotidyltransferase [Virgibacillus chiguensis]|uniref:CCA-adding enzyme n=1 Tax=Virgibacillus chiguensis TaxID=411959 RepID=A0A1M5LEF8_9BACI|nr:CCA tRNA nucleotidyltransferase [Virgibacillus chiguensis]SHG63494.1 tRNA nucleotidyltransferase (CCA-adding enzyme) [Virgibacillus chiguensis]